MLLHKDCKAPKAMREVFAANPLPHTLLIKNVM